MNLKSAIDLLIYLSVIFGVILLVQLYTLVPNWLFYSVLSGWVIYVVVAIFAATGRKEAYPLALVLAILTLFSSLPQPEHYAYVKQGVNLASVTFLTGSTLQIALIVLDGIYLTKRRNKA